MQLSKAGIWKAQESHLWDRLVAAPCKQGQNEMGVKIPMDRHWGNPELGAASYDYP